MAHKLCKLLVVGVGSIGERHVRCFQSTGRCEVSICEPNGPLREKVAERYGIRRCYDDMQAALVEPHDAAVIAVPAHLHIPIAQVVADAGLHLLIEKPLSVSRDGIAKLIETIERNTLVASVAYVHRAHPALGAMRAAIAAGRFGRPLQLIVVSGQSFPIYRPAYRETYYTDRATGGGAIQDALTHMFNTGQWLVGPMDRLVADADHKVLEGTEVEDIVHVLARHGSVMASYSLNQFQPQNEMTITVVCQRGTVRFEYHHNRWRWMVEPDEPWHDESAETPDRDTLFARQANGFLDAIEHKAKPLCTLDEGVQSLNANLAALDSLKARSWTPLSKELATTSPNEP